MSGEAPDWTIEARLFAKHIAQAPENTERNELLAKRVMELSYALGRKEGIEEAAKVADRIGNQRSELRYLSILHGKPAAVDVGYVGYTIRQLLEVKG